MKKFSLSFVFFLLVVFLAVSNITSARVLLPNIVQDNQGLKIKDTAKNEDVYNLMGLDEKELCGNKKGEECNEECNAERKLLEAHLDYIYTQKHHKP